MKSITDKQHHEVYAMKVSLIANVFCAVLGVIAAIYSNAGAILLDALYSCISIIMAYLGLKISELVYSEPSKKFQFGYASFEPMFVSLNGIFVLLIAVSALASSIVAIFAGGREIELTILLVYFFMSMLISFALGFYLRKKEALTARSNILRSESAVWFVDGFMGLAGIAAFSLIIPLSHSKYNFLINYVDPVVTIIMVGVIIIQPLKLVRNGVMDLLQAAPPRYIVDNIRRTLYQVNEKYGFDRIDVYASKTGRQINIYVYCICPKDFKINGISQLDDIKDNLKTYILALGYSNLDIEVIFTAKDE